MKSIYVEVCASCMRACGLVQNKTEAHSLIKEVETELKSQGLEALSIEAGQCQRYCPENRITVSMGVDPSGRDRRLGATYCGSVDSLKEFVGSKAKSFLDK
ncbi:MAG: hypothetical protein ACLGGX_04625 [Bdellovibrionia bacterium]